MSIETRERPTAGFAFLDIARPYVAWAVYRGVLITPQKTPSAGGRFVSWWWTSLLRYKTHLKRELELEQVRKRQFPDRVSRIVGLYCFLDKACADQALVWDGHFRPDNLAELSLAESTQGGQLLDANWISSGTLEVDGRHADWMERYWSGEPYPEAQPVWETLVKGKVSVLGTDLRDRAYEVVKHCWPESLMLLEISRMGAWLGSNIGTINVIMAETAAEYKFDFLLDMRDAQNPDFIERLQRLMASGHPVNWVDIKPHYERGTFGRTPDMTPFQFSVGRGAIMQ